MESGRELRDALIRRAREEAERIVKEAKDRANKIIEEAKRKFEERIRRERSELLSKIIEEESRKYTSKIVELNKEIVNVKNEVLNELKMKILNNLRSLSKEERERSLRGLLREAINSGLFRNYKVIVKVVPDDVEIVKKIIKRDKELRNLVIKIDKLSNEYVGGVILESEDGSIVLDNTYLARLDRLLPSIIRRLNKEVFGVNQ